MYGQYSSFSKYRPRNHLLQERKQMPKVWATKPSSRISVSGSTNHRNAYQYKNMSQQVLLSNQKEQMNYGLKRECPACGSQFPSWFGGTEEQKLKSFFKKEQNLKKDRERQEQKYLGQINHWKGQVGQQEKTIAKLNEEYSRLEKEKKQSEKKKDEIQREKERLSTQLAQSEAEIYNLRDQRIPFFDNLFRTEIIANNPDRTFLVSEVENFKDKKLKDTYLIYRYDELNEANPHKYIDDIEDILILIRTEKDYFLGAFIEGGITRQEKVKRAFIFSLNNKRVFPFVNQKEKVTTYDEYHLLIGNAQIRIPTTKKVVYSSFGMVNNYFQTEGENANILFGMGYIREAPIKTFSIFKCTFN